jgi:hypothetical protein
MVTVTGIALSPQPTAVPDWPLSSRAIRKILTVCPVEAAAVHVGGTGWGWVAVGKKSVGEATGGVTVGLTTAIVGVGRIAVFVGISAVPVGIAVARGSILTSNCPQAVRDNNRSAISNLGTFIEPLFWKMVSF